MYSQNDEERHILNYFGSEQGRLLDIGAFTGVELSNSYQLLLQGWEGVLYEASPEVFRSLQENLSGLSAICINKAVTVDQDGPITFYDNAGAVATTSASHRDKWSSKAQFNEIQVEAISLPTLIHQHGQSFDFVTIDVEGQSAELFLNLYHLMPSVRMWIVEHDSRIDEILIAAVGHRLISQNGENVILVSILAE